MVSINGRCGDAPIATCDEVPQHQVHDYFFKLQRQQRVHEAEGCNRQVLEQPSVPSA